MLVNDYTMSRIMRAPEDGAGGGAGGAGGDDDAADAAAAAAGGGEEGEEPRVYAKKYKTIDELEAGYVELSKKLGQTDDERRQAMTDEISASMREGVPAEATEYAFTPPDGMIPEGMEFSMEPDNPVFGKWQAFAHRIGLSPADFNEATALYIENELMMLPDPAAQRKALGENAEGRIERVQLWSKKNLSEDSYNAVMEGSTSAAMIVAFEEMMAQSGDGGDVGGGNDGGDGGKLTREELEKMMIDPRYRDPRKREQSFVNKVQAGFQALYPKK